MTLALDMLHLMERQKRSDGSFTIICEIDLTQKQRNELEARGSIRFRDSAEFTMPNLLENKEITSISVDTPPLEVYHAVYSKGLDGTRIIGIFADEC